jgi:hypothetical protein
MIPASLTQHVFVELFLWTGHHFRPIKFSRKKADRETVKHRPQESSVLIYMNSDILSTEMGQNKGKLLKYGKS